MTASRSLPSLNALKAFEAAARLGSVTAAAEELSVTHGAVSRQIRALEAHFDTVLFDRSGRGLVLTPKGDRLHNGVSQAFAGLRESCQSLVRELEGAPFTLACPGSLLARWLIPRLERLHRELSELRLHVFASEGDPDPRRHDISAMLAFLEPPWPADMTVIELAPETIGAVAVPDIADTLIDQPLEALYRYTVLDTASRPQAWRAWARHTGIDPVQLDEARRRGQGFEHLYYLLEAALAGLGVAVAPKLLIADDLAQRRLVAPWGFVETSARLCLLLPAHAPRQAGERLAAWLREEIGAGEDVNGQTCP
ncbi:LysR family transcriptional regulator [Kushneria phosphatilytica]|uniref:LysR family transcriptional regulator n=1 Tax=Kushneria phosphatilytica TaxID=657387 RepID=A0A1S1NNG0_9GAMM|nr:LysR family transcriptional regulator [Kushneria phosphatilytica]OHV08857.1 transcriptional regulator [Kushneria phosphatilytica]QEL12577.1 LysR family transcriptional regulator [Kushneria phosphatilytica]